MNGSDATYALPVLATYACGGIAAAVVGDADLVTDLLAGGGVGALFGQLLVLRRFRQGIRGREAQIVAAWSVGSALLGALAHLVTALI